MLSDAWSDLILFKSISHLISSRFQTNKRKRPQCLYICGRGTTEISRINCGRCGLDKEKLSNFENFFLHVDVDWMSYNNKMLFLNSFVANRQGKGIHKQSIRLYELLAIQWPVCWPLFQCSATFPFHIYSFLSQLNIYLITGHYIIITSDTSTKQIFSSSV